MSPRRHPAAITLLAGSLLAGACASDQPNRNTGGAVGAVAGGILGAVLGNNSKMGTAAGAAIGAMTGFIAGSLIGQLLDDADRAKQEAASQRALTTGDEVIHWNSDKNKGVHGYSEAVGEAAAPPPRRPSRGEATATAPAGAGCRIVREVAYVDGKEYVEMVEYCRVAGTGGWTRKTA